MAQLPAGVRVEIHSDNPKADRYGRWINEFLTHVPPDHLVGLSKIVIGDRIKDKNYRNALGVYYVRNRRVDAHIELALSRVFADLPKPIAAIPALQRYRLAGVLFHEIGHHYETRRMHGISRIEGEKVAEQYKHKMRMRAFRCWRPLVIATTPFIVPPLRLFLWVARRRGKLGGDGPTRPS